MAPAATGEAPGRGRAKRVGFRRLGAISRCAIALRYARGEKTLAIAAEFGTSSGYISTIARTYGLAKRNRRWPVIRPAEIAALQAWAKLQAEAQRAMAEEWRRLAE